MIQGDDSISSFSHGGWGWDGSGCGGCGGAGRGWWGEGGCWVVGQSGSISVVFM